MMSRWQFPTRTGVPLMRSAAARLVWVIERTEEGSALGLARNICRANSDVALGRFADVAIIAFSRLLSIPQ